MIRRASSGRIAVAAVVCLSLAALAIVFVRPDVPIWQRTLMVWLTLLAGFLSLGFLGARHRLDARTVRSYIAIVALLLVGSFMAVCFIPSAWPFFQGIAVLVTAVLISNMLYFIVARVRLIFYRPTPVPDHSHRTDWPTVTVLLAVRNEPVEVVRQTISSALETDYPADRLSVIVVDNSDDAEHVQVVESMLATLGDGTVKFIHRDGTQGYKPYNLDLAMKQIDSDYVFLLDADSTLTFDALKASGATLDTDPELGMAQLITISTNGSVGVFARASALFVSMLRTSIGMLNDSGGFLFFYGHNGMWRTAALREVGPWEQYYRGRIMIGEDRMLSLLAYAAGYRGATVDRLAGEWAPMTINEFRSTYQRWCYAFCQSLSRDGLRLMTSAGASGLAKFDELQRELNIFACSLVPLFLITALVSRGSIIETFYLGTFLLFEIAGSLAVYFRFARGGHSAKKFRQACGAGFLVASYGSWISAVSAIRFALGLPQGWTPTSKSADDSSGLRATFASHKVMTAYSVLVLALTACVYVVRARDGELDGAEALDLGLGAAFALSLMLFLVVYGRDRSAPVPDSEMMTINRVQSPFE